MEDFARKWRWKVVVDEEDKEEENVDKQTQRTF